MLRFGLHRLDNLSTTLIVLKITDAIYLFVFYMTAITGVGPPRS